MRLHTLSALCLVFTWVAGCDDGGSTESSMTDIEVTVDTTDRSETSTRDAEDDSTDATVAEVEDDSADVTITEADIVRCEAGDVCIVVAYDHCCGSTRRAINEAYEEAYSSHPEWQSFYEEECALIGACASDEHLNNAVCNSDTGLCELAE